MLEVQRLPVIKMETQGNRPLDITVSRNCFFVMMNLREPGEPNLIATYISFNMSKHTFEATTLPFMHRTKCFCTCNHFVSFEFVHLVKWVNFVIDMEIIKIEKQLIKSIHGNVSSSLKEKFIIHNQMRVTGKEKVQSNI